MGFLRRLFTTNKNKKKTQSPPSKCTFIRSSKSAISTTSILSTYEGGGRDANKHAIAVAAATAAVAEAALDAAEAAAEVVRLTTGNGRAGGVHYRLTVLAAAVVIQSAFRGYLARRALRALKALVKLQALVRGHIVRRQTSDMLRRMQTLVRLQARARATRAHVSESFHSSHTSQDPVFVNLGKNEKPCAYNKTSGGPSVKRCGSNSNSRDVVLDKTRTGSTWLNRWMEDVDERNDKILEVDTWKPNLNSYRINKSFGSSQHVFSSDYKPMDSRSKISPKAPNRVPSGDALSLSSLKDHVQKDEVGSSRPGSCNSRRGPFTPTRSECSWGYFAGHPNYMANTESSKAKVRSHSAPRQRLELERYGSTRRNLQALLDTSINSEKGYALHGEYSRNYAYPASGQSNKLGSTDLRR